MCETHTIKPFLPGHIWKSSTETLTKWYNPTYNYCDINLSFFDEAAAYKATAELLYKATVKRMMSDRPIGTFLSGGLDSSVVAAFIKKFHKENGMKTNLNTFSVGLEDSPDLAYA